jgi:hypothetical protein
LKRVGLLYYKFLLLNFDLLVQNLNLLFVVYWLTLLELSKNLL